MGRKILKTATGGIFGGKKKAKAADTNTTSQPDPVIGELSADEVKRRKLLRKPGQAANVTSTILGAPTALSGTLGG